MRVLRENLATIVAGLCVVALFVASLVVFGPWRTVDPKQGTGEGLCVVIHDANGDVQTYSLDQDRTVELVSDKGRNVIAIESGSVRMAEADCPRGVCLKQKPLDGPGQQLVCLPHELWVEVTYASDGSGDDSGNAPDATGAADVDFVAG